MPGPMNGPEAARFGLAGTMKCLLPGKGFLPRARRLHSQAVRIIVFLYEEKGESALVSVRRLPVFMSQLAPTR
jgi:hypothetical protein